MLSFPHCAMFTFVLVENSEFPDVPILYENVYRDKRNHIKQQKCSPDTEEEVFHLFSFHLGVSG